MARTNPGIGLGSQCCKCCYYNILQENYGFDFFVVFHRPAQHLVEIIWSIGGPSKTIKS